LALPLSRGVRLALLATGLLAVILIPFFIWEDIFNDWSKAALAPDRPRAAIAAAVVLLLAADVFLPIPSSIVSTGAGLLLGFWGGVAATFTGMGIGCCLGYAAGRFARPLVVPRLLSAEEMGAMEARFRRHGDWTVMLTRPVPVLAEAAGVCAGLLRRAWWRFLVVSSLSNLGVAIAYSAVGALALSMESFVLAFAGSIVLPYIAMQLMGAKK